MDGWIDGWITKGVGTRGGVSGHPLNDSVFTLMADSFRKQRELEKNSRLGPIEM